jgi:hypothetical protein
VIGLDCTYLLNNYNLKNVNTGRKSLSEGYTALEATIQNTGESIENGHTSGSVTSVIIIGTAIAVALGPILPARPSSQSHDLCDRPGKAAV